MIFDEFWLFITYIFQPLWFIFDIFCISLLENTFYLLHCSLNEAFEILVLMIIKVSWNLIETYFKINFKINSKLLFLLIYIIFFFLTKKIKKLKNKWNNIFIDYINDIKIQKNVKEFKNMWLLHFYL